MNQRARYALKFGYSGKPFHGYQRQPGIRTVEGDILEAMISTGIIQNFENAEFKSASRTDRGVSALGNVLAVNTEFRNNELLPALNANLDSIWFYGLARIDIDFNPRHAKWRRYRYYLPPEKRDPLILKKIASVFIGTHDFNSFCYSVRGKDTKRTVSNIIIMPRKNYIAIDIIAPNFLWGMVRMIVSAILRVESREAELSDLRRALKGGKRIDFGIAPPEPLVLIDVKYNFNFDTICGGKTPMIDLNQRMWACVLERLFIRDMIKKVVCV